MQTQVIYRHWFGALAIGLLGGGVVGALLLFMWTQLKPVDPLNYIVAGIAILVGLITILYIHVYSQTTMTLDRFGINVHNQFAPFYSETGGAVDWNGIQSVTVTKPGVFASLLNYGTIVVQTADALPTLKMTYVPTPDAWKEYIDQNAHLS